MIFSRNPISGQMESYTDDGVYVGIVPTMGDFITSDGDHAATDGGPGSGNYGHKGRPGKRGGSGPGGGKQYRGGRSDIGYFNSREDWLNGLQGEEQHKAVRFIAQKKKDLESKLKAKEKIDDLYKRGMLNYDEWEERAKEGRLDGLYDGMSAEEYVMKGGSMDERKEMVSSMGKARSWPETAKRLMSENLDETDQKLMKALSEKYGVEQSVQPFAAIPDENDMDKWAPEDQECYLDLKSKAMGGPTSGKEAPDELQYVAGTKQKPVTIPMSKQDNTKWLANFPEPEQELALDLLQDIGITPFDFAGNMDMNWAEVQLMNHLWMGDKKALSTAKNYLREKDALLGNGYFKMVSNAANENVGAIGSASSIILSEYLEQIAKEQQEKFPGMTVEKDGYMLESLLLGDSNTPNQEKCFYLQMKALALGLKTMGMSEADVKQSLHRALNERKERYEAEKTFGPKRQSFKQDRAAREKSYSEATSANQVGELMRSSGMFRNKAAVTMSKSDLKCAQEVAKAYETVMDRYPFLIGQLDGLDENETGSASVYASCSTKVGGKVHLNASDRFFGNFNNLLSSYQEDVRSKYHPEGTNGTAVAIHEIGHALDGFLSQKGTVGAKLFSTDANAFSGILRRRVLKSLKMTKSMVANELSRYAEKNAYEWFAECFAEGMTSENPRPMAKEMMRQLDQILREEGLLNA